MKDRSSRLIDYLNGLTPGRGFLLALAATISLGLLDLGSPLAMSFSLCYVLVIGFAGWVSGTGTATALALLPTIVTWWEDWRSFAEGWSPVLLWNVSTRFLLFMLVGWVCAAMSRVTRAHERTAEERTEQWKAEAERHRATSGRLAETVERFEQVINNITEVFWLTNLEKTEMIYISPGYERIWGRSCSELYARPLSWLESIHPVDQAEIARRSKSEQATQRYDVEYRIIRPDGTERWIRDRAFPVRNSAGEIYRVAGIAENITGDRQMQKALAEAHELTDTIVQASPAGIAAWKATGECVMANEALARIIGGTADQILRQNFRSLESWRKHGLLEHADRVLATKTPLTIDYHGFSSFGQELFLTLQLAHCIVKGEPHLLVVLNDISDQRRAEAALREMDSRLRTAITGAPIALFSVDARGTITFEDGRALREIGGDPASHIGKPAAEVYAHNPDILVNLSRALQGEDFSALVRFGPVVMECYYAPMRNAAGDLIGMSGVGTNITERLRLERQILEITDREQARIGQDIHDGLCQELVSIAFDASHLEAQLESTHHPEAVRARRMAVELDEAITKARQVARGLFPIRMEGEGVVSALEELAAGVTERSGIECAFNLQSPVNLPEGHIATHLYRIAQEAVNNAIKHSSAGRIEINLGTRDGEVLLEVMDDGIGLPKQTGPRSSDGMGMHIMRYRARMIGASLAVKPREDRGTLISCSLAGPANAEP